MKIKRSMIDKQLRTKGLIYKVLMGKTNESKYTRTVKKAKERMDKTQKGINIEGLSCTEEWIPRSDGPPMRTRIYKPLHPKENVSGVLWLHGGGYALGIPEMNPRMYKALIDQSDCVIVAPDYRLSTEAPYPAALEDCYEALKWMKNNAKELGINENQLMVGGESAGGGLTAALTLYARDKGEVNIAFQMPLYPMIDDRMITESAKENNAPIWDSNSNRFAWKLYLGDNFGKNTSPYAAAARATDYSNLPPTVTFVGDIEPFRDETMEYVENLRKAGIPVDFELCKGCYHGFDMIVPEAEVSKMAYSFLLKSFAYAVHHYFAEQNNSNHRHN